MNAGLLNEVNRMKNEKVEGLKYYVKKLALSLPAMVSKSEVLSSMGQNQNKGFGRKHLGRKLRIETVF